MAEQAAEILAVAQAARALEQHEAALLLFRRVRELDARSVEALAAIAELTETLGDQGEAVAARLGLVELYIGSQQLERAAEQVERILAIAPDEPLARSYREFIDGRLNPEAGISGARLVPQAIDDEITAPVSALEPGSEDPDDDEEEDDDEDWEVQTTAVITAANMKELLAQPDAAAEWTAQATIADDFAAPIKTIALGGQGAAVAIAKLIGTSPLLRALDAAGCSRLLADGDVVQCFAGQEIVEQGTQGSSMFLVLEGEAVAERSGRKLETVSAGSFFGEATLIGETPRLATVRVTSDATLVEIDRPLVKALSATQTRLLGVLGHVLRARAIKIQLAESPVLSRIPPALLGELTPLFHLHKIRRGRRVATSGQVPSGYWEVVVGLIEAVDADGAASSDLSAGSGFGMGSLAGQPSAVTLAAITPCWLLELPVADLTRMIERYPVLGEVFTTR